MAGGEKATAWRGNSAAILTDWSDPRCETSCVTKTPGEGHAGSLSLPWTPTPARGHTQVTSGDPSTGVSHLQWHEQSWGGPGPSAGSAKARGGGEEYRCIEIRGNKSFL